MKTGIEFIDKIDTYIKLMAHEYTSEEVFAKIGKMENYGVYYRATP